MRPPGPVTQGQALSRNVGAIPMARPAIGAGAALAIMETLADFGAVSVYFDLVEFERYGAKHQTPNTPALSLLYALDAQLEAILGEGVEARWARHAKMAARTHEWVTEISAQTGLSLGILAPAGSRSPTVTTVSLPPHLNAGDVVREAAARGYVVGDGYGPLRDRTFRIGHMGDHTLETLDGGTVSLSQWVGKKPVLLEFWASWCPNCKALEPAMEAAHTEFGDRVEFIGIAVSVNQPVDRVKRYMERYSLPMTMLYDRRGDASAAYDAPATSYVVVLDASGSMAARSGSDTRMGQAKQAIGEGATLVLAAGGLATSAASSSVM